MTNSDLTTDVDVLVVGAGQAGLAAGMALRQAGLGFMIVDAAGQPGGSWPRYYDSLTLFSPARFSTLPGRRLPGRLSRHPSRDDMTRYLRDYATHFQLPVRTGARVLDTSRDGEAFGGDFGRRRPAHSARRDRDLRRVRAACNPRASRRQQLHRSAAPLRRLSER
jgi:cation diffusion facilitator CzcD-associated flavoprotein CzcO